MNRRKLSVLVIAAGLLFAGTPAALAAAGSATLTANSAAAGGSGQAKVLTPSALAGSVEFDPLGPSHLPYYSTVGIPPSVIETGTVGQYQVTFGSLGFTGGDAQLTAGSGACVIQSWAKTAVGDLAVNVNCYSGLGTPSPEPFNLAVTKPTRTPAGVFDYALVPGTGTGLVKAYEYNSSHKANTVKHLGTGQYLVTMPGPGTKGASAGTVKISANGNVPGACQLAKWLGTSTGQQIYVDCFALTGARQNTPFTVVYTRGNNVMGQDTLTDANALANHAGDLYQPGIQFDSKLGARVSIAHLQAGVYLFIPAGSDLTSRVNGGRGDLQVTTAGSTYAACGFSIVRTHLPLIEVACINAGGNNVNSAFTAQWAVN
jgi:hypothetical protein